MELPYILNSALPLHLPSHWMHGAWFCVSESLSSQALPRLKKDLLPLFSHDTWWVSWGGFFMIIGIMKNLLKTYLGGIPNK
jgi:hypothetical protein